MQLAFPGTFPHQAKGHLRMSFLLCLVGGEKEGGSEARAHRVTGQKQSGGLFLGRGLRLCSQWVGNGR